MELEAAATNGTGGDRPSRGKWRVRFIVTAIFAALAAGAVVYGPAAVEHFLVKTTRDRYQIPGNTQVERVTRVLRLGDVTHGVQEEWYWNGLQKSRATFHRGKLLESIHWGRDGLLDGWRLPAGGVEVSWLEGRFKIQTRVRQTSGGQNVVVEFRSVEIMNRRGVDTGDGTGKYTPQEIIEFVRSYNASAPGQVVELVIPPIQAPRRVAGAVPEER